MTRPKILLGVTGSVAAIRAPELINALGEIGEIQVIATKASLYFWDRTEAKARVWTDEDEWIGGRYARDQDIPHIALGEWADLLVIAPLTANTAAKLALGFSDNLLSCLYCAWPVGKPIVLAPAMNTRMWENPTVRAHVERLGARHAIVGPIVKKLACGTTGIGAMAEVPEIVQAVRAALP